MRPAIGGAKFASGTLGQKVLLFTSMYLLSVSLTCKFSAWQCRYDCCLAKICLLRTINNILFTCHPDQFSLVNFKLFENLHFLNKKTPFTFHNQHFTITILLLLTVTTLVCNMSKIHLQTIIPNSQTSQVFTLSKKALLPRFVIDTPNASLHTQDFLRASR